MKTVPFPAGTCGFLYFHRPSFVPPFAGEVRFRLVPSGDPRDFDSGTDLLDHTGCLPYKLDALRIMSVTSKRPMMDVLLQDGFISADDVAHVHRLFPPSTSSRARPTLLYAYQQPFFFKFGDITRHFTLLAYQNEKLFMKVVRFRYRPRVTGDENLIPPYLGAHCNGYNKRKFHRSDFARFTGSAICCFEHVKEDDAICLKILQIVDPIRYVDTADTHTYPEPKAGEYLQMKKGRWKSQLQFGARGQIWLSLLKEYPGVTSDMF